jgi:hypothetical protein
MTQFGMTEISRPCYKITVGRDCRQIIDGYAKLPSPNREPSLFLTNTPL